MATPQTPPAVVLVGFMGAGKSAVGRALATLLGLAYLDTDAAVVSEAGPIAGIFAERGEQGFRELEAVTVNRELEALRKAPKVLALGGGAVVSGEVRAALRRAAHVVWLTAPAAELWRRIASDDGAERPLARDEAAFRELLAAREPLYREVATIIMDTAGRRAEEVAGELAAVVRGETTGVTGAPRAAREGAA